MVHSALVSDFYKLRESITFLQNINNSKIYIITEFINSILHVLLSIFSYVDMRRYTGACAIFLGVYTCSHLFIRIYQD